MLLRILPTLLLLVYFLSPAFTKDLNPTKPEIRAFLKADANKDRVLSINEFKKFIKTMAASGQSTAKTIRFFGAYGYAFSVVDKNNDGILTPREMRSADNNYRAKP